jgi:GAF domain-containing protein
MNDDPRPEQFDALAEAQRTIERQAAEIERLRRRAADERLADELRDAIQLAATAGTIAAPVTYSRLLEMIVETAADVINARAASLFLIDEAAQELTFEVALGEKAEEAKKFRVPLGKGIAGLVALSGQPMAIADTAADDRDASDLADKIGYRPKNILCVPLFYEDRVIGVLELLDKNGADSFSAADLEALGLFANQAAVAIEQSRTQRAVASLLGGVLQSLTGIPDYERQGLETRARAFGADLEQDANYRRALELARLVQDISQRGEREYVACRAILNGFAEYLRSRPQALGDLATFGDTGAF